MIWAKSINFYNPVDSSAITTFWGGGDWMPDPFNSGYFAFTCR